LLPSALPTGSSTPDPDAWRPLLAGLVDFNNFFFLSAEASVVLGGTTYDFEGFSENYFYVLDRFEVHSDQPVTPGWVASCKHLIALDDARVVTVAFGQRFDPQSEDEFSFADNGSGTVIWGLRDASTGEEWTGTGPGAADIGEYVGRDLLRDNLITSYHWSGTATEHYSFEKRPFDISIRCIWQVRRPDLVYWHRYM
jgi:hypothetical protein